MRICNSFTIRILIFSLIVSTSYAQSVEYDYSPNTLSDDETTSESDSSTEEAATSTPETQKTSAPEPINTRTSASERPSTISEAENTRVINLYLRGRSEIWTEANNCYNIFRHHTIVGEMVIPAARFNTHNKASYVNALTTSGFVKLQDDTLEGSLEIAKYMHAGTEGALVVWNEDNTQAHIVNVYMANDRTLYLRDFGYGPDDNGMLYNSYNWKYAALYVNNNPKRQRPGNAYVEGRAATESDTAETMGRFSERLQTLINAKKFQNTK